jgi:hypothetical protein
MSCSNGGQWRMNVITWTLAAWTRSSWGLKGMASKMHDDGEEIGIDNVVEDADGEARCDPRGKTAVGGLGDESTTTILARLSSLCDALPQALQKIDDLLEEQLAIKTLEHELANVRGNVEQGVAHMLKLAKFVTRRFDEIAALSSQTLSEARTKSQEQAASPTVAAASQEMPPEPVGKTPHDGRGLERLFFGDYLLTRDDLDDQRLRLVQGLGDGDPAAIGLLGRLLLLNAATAEEIPPLLKEIGEAYYRWQPRTADEPASLETALVDALNQRAAEVGLKNTVELVHLRDRYDTSRHVTTDRGVEVIGIHGWVVLRENGKALTKASVSLK